MAGIMLATRLKTMRGHDVEVYFFGPGVKLAGQASGPVKEALDKLLEAVPTGVCPFNADQFEVRDALNASGYKMEPAGEALARLIEDGYEVVGY